MSFRKHIIILLIFFSLSVSAVGKEAEISMRTIDSTDSRLAPHDRSPRCERLEKGSVISIQFSSNNWYGYSPRNQSSTTCWIPSAQLSEIQTRGVPLLLVPVAVKAGTMVVNWLISKFLDKSKVMIQPGSFVEILKRADGKVQVKTAEGKIGWLSEKALSMVQEIHSMPASEKNIYMGSKPIEQSNQLNIDVYLQRPDGAIIPNGGTLQLGDEYEVHVRCNKDCYIRILGETPSRGSICQYSPNQFSGYSVSPLIRANEDAWPYLLPSNVRFQVHEPIEDKDMIRVEAVSASHNIPFRYVAANDQGDGCAGIDGNTGYTSDGRQVSCSEGNARGAGFRVSGCGYRSGGFSVTKSGEQNPVAERVFLFTIHTIR